MHSRMWQAALMLLLSHSCVPAMSLKTGPSDQQGFVDLSREFSVGTTKHEGNVLQVFGIDDFQFAEPSIKLEQSCPTVEYNMASLQYEMSLPVQITANALKQPTSNGAKLAVVTLSDVEVQADSELVGTGSNRAQVKMLLFDSGKAEFRFLCPTLLHCQQIRDAVQLNPRMMQNNVRIVVLARIGGVPVKFAAMRCATPPSNLIKSDSWIPFLRRADISFSFARGWDEYVAGFGSPDFRHYWMGLEKLHQATNRAGRTCTLRMEAGDLTRKKQYWAEWDGFSVTGLQDGYRLKLGAMRGHSEDINPTESLEHNANAKFSTYDRENDGYGSSCSLKNGKAGWWFHGCHYVCLTRTPMEIRAAGTRVESVSSALMIFRCS